MKREDGLPKPRALKPAVKRLIASRAITQRQVPRDYLAHQLIKEIKEARETTPPTLETIKRYISAARNARNPIDEPWTLGACRDYPTLFPPSSLLFLMKMQEESKTFVDIFTNIRSQGYSIRKAMWIVRLQPLVKEYFGPDDVKDEHMILANIAEAYSFAERTSEIMGEPAFNTADLDDSLCSQNLDNIFLFGPFGYRNTSSICEGDCDSCKYVPIVKGKLCQPKVIYQEREMYRKEMVEKGWVLPDEKGD